MISQLWTLNGDKLSDLNLSGFQISEVNQTPGVLRFQEYREVDQDPTFSYDEAITLSYNNEAIFKGRITTRPRRQTANAEIIDYVAADAWRDLERCVFQQEWRTTNGTTADLISTRKS